MMLTKMGVIIATMNVIFFATNVETGQEVELTFDEAVENGFLDEDSNFTINN